jgi:hypothetical protein
VNSITISVGGSLPHLSPACSAVGPWSLSRLVRRQALTGDAKGNRHVVDPETTSSPRRQVDAPGRESDRPWAARDPHRDGRAAEQAAGGSPACWLERVCGDCGALSDGPPEAVCPRCGARRP